MESVWFWPHRLVVQVVLPQRDAPARRPSKRRFFSDKRFHNTRPEPVLTKARFLVTEETAKKRRRNGVIKTSSIFDAPGLDPRGELLRPKRQHLHRRQQVRRQRQLAVAAATASTVATTSAGALAEREPCKTRLFYSTSRRSSRACLANDRFYLNMAWQQGRLSVPGGDHSCLKSWAAAAARFCVEGRGPRPTACVCKRKTPRSKLWRCCCLCLSGAWLGKRGASVRLFYQRMGVFRTPLRALPVRCARTCKSKAVLSVSDGF